MYSSSFSGLKTLVDHKAVGDPPFHNPSTSEASTVTAPAEVGTAHLYKHTPSWFNVSYQCMYMQKLTCVLLVFPSLCVKQEAPDVIFIKDEEDMGGCRPAVGEH